MHEWALAEAVLSAASEIAEKERLKEVTEVKVKVGELQGIELDILEFAFAQLKTGKFKNTKFKIETEKAKLQCRACGQTWSLSRENMDENAAEAIHFVPEIAHTYVKCPKCSSPDFEVLQGRGVTLETVKGAK
jgi:hydrogenase nickel incorporation protein HypA/HybF